MVHVSDSGDAGSQIPSFNKFRTEQHSTSVLHESCDLQPTINQQILAQLSDIDQLLKKLENTDCKKSNAMTKIKNRSTRTRSKATQNITTKSTESTGHSIVTSALSDTVTGPFNTSNTPSLTDIRQNAQIQEKVGQRIKELQQLSNPGMDTKIKSLRGGTANIFVKHCIKWPHGHILPRNTKEQVSYNELTMGQWMASFCRTMMEELNLKKKLCLTI